MSWAEGTGGCGLVAVQQVLEKIVDSKDEGKITGILLGSRTAPPSSYTTNVSGGQVGSVLNVNQAGTVIVQQPKVSPSETHPQIEPAIRESHNITKYIEILPNDCIIARLFKDCFGSFPKAIEWVNANNPPKDFLSKAGQTYTDQLEKLYNTIRIWGMTEPIPLKGIYTRVNILKKITSLQRVTISDLEERLNKDRRGFGDKAETIGGIETVNKLSKFTVLGKPGAGKTTFLKYITLQAANGLLEAKHIPVFISLKSWSDSTKSLVDFIVEQFDICCFPESKPFVEHMLGQGKCLVLLDGLDEVSKEKEERVINEVREFSSRYIENQFILTCRLAAYNYTFEHFTIVEMADFDDDQIENFIYSWFGSNQKKAEQCWIELKADPPIKELASIPLLLTLLCLAFDETLRFPKNRAELYKEAIDALLKKWDSSRNIFRQEIYKNLPILRKETLLSHVAMLTFEAGQYFIPQRALESHISDFIQNLPDVKKENLLMDSEAVLKSVEAQHGIFVERARGIYSFSHLTFQEYFTAKYIIDNKEQVLKRLVDGHITDDKWREVFLLTAGMLPKADDLLLLMKTQIDSMVDEKLAEFLTIVLNNAKLDKAIKEALSEIGFISTSGSTSVAIRAYKIYFVLARDLDRAQARALAFDLARALARDLALIHALALARNHTLARDRALTLESYLAANLILVQCLTQTECYVTKPTREKILNELLTVPEGW
ncbi:MAG: NACHT domain-containing protein [Acidobacteriota bacterium]